MLWLGKELEQCQKYLKINIFFFKVAKTNTKKEKLLVLIPENVGDRLLSVCKTQIPTEYWKKDIWGCFKN